jgi:rubrerythrin
MIALAYGMEMGLGVFYRQMIERTDDAEMQALFAKLADIEQHHKKRLFDLLTEVDPPDNDIEAYEAELQPTSLEGGFQLDAFVKQNESFLRAVPDVLDLAMMLETQALDLYLRFAEKSTDNRTRDILFTIADEEKAHLQSLGRLLEDKI